MHQQLFLKLAHKAASFPHIPPLLHSPSPSRAWHSLSLPHLLCSSLSLSLSLSIAVCHSLSHSLALSTFLLLLLLLHLLTSVSPLLVSPLPKILYKRKTPEKKGVGKGECMERLGWWGVTHVV